MQKHFRGLFCWNVLLLICAPIKIKTIKLTRRQLGFLFYHLRSVYSSFCTFPDIFATCLSDRDGQRWFFVALNKVFSFYKNKNCPECQQVIFCSSKSWKRKLYAKAWASSWPENWQPTFRQWFPHEIGSWSKDVLSDESQPEVAFFHSRAVVSP